MSAQKAEDYHENIELVDPKENLIVGFDEQGILAVDEGREANVVILATWYTSVIL